MRWILIVFALMLVGLLSVYSLSISDLVFYVNSTAFHDYKGKSSMSYQSDEYNPRDLIDKTQVEIIKSFKNSSGFYKINGTLENQGAMILSNVKVIKYYKIPSVNDTTLICYEAAIVSCEYKSINQVHPESFFLTIPDANIKPK